MHRQPSHHKEATTAFSSHPFIHLLCLTWRELAYWVEIFPYPPKDKPGPTMPVQALPSPENFRGEPRATPGVGANMLESGKDLHVPPASALNERKALHAREWTCAQVTLQSSQWMLALDPPPTRRKEAQVTEGKTQLCCHSAPQSQCERGPSTQTEVATCPREESSHYK